MCWKVAEKAHRFIGERLSTFSLRPDAKEKYAFWSDNVWFCSRHQRIEFRSKYIHAWWWTDDIRAISTFHSHKREHFLHHSCLTFGIESRIFLCDYTKSHLFFFFALFLPSFATSFVRLNFIRNWRNKKKYGPFWYDCVNHWKTSCDILFALVMLCMSLHFICVTFSWTFFFVFVTSRVHLFSSLFFILFFYDLMIHHLNECEQKCCIEMPTAWQTLFFFLPLFIVVLALHSRQRKRFVFHVKSSKRKTEKISEKTRKFWNNRAVAMAFLKITEKMVDARYDWMAHSSSAIPFLIGSRINICPCVSIIPFHSFCMFTRMNALNWLVKCDDSFASPLSIEWRTQRKKKRAKITQWKMEK